MRKRTQITLTHPTQQPRERLRRIHLRPQHQRIDEHPDQIIENLLTTTRHRSTDRNIGRPRQPRQQHRQRRMHHHEQRRIRLTRSVTQRHMHITINHERIRSTTIGRHRRPRTISRQIQLIRQTRQRRLPEPDLTRNQRPRIIFRPQSLPLPQRVIRILHRQRRPPRHLTPRTSLVRHHHITRQRPHRHTITTDVMNHHRQHELRLRHREQPRPNRNLHRHIETSRQELRHRTNDIGLRHRHRRQIQPHPIRRQHLLEPDTVDLRIHRPQNLMPTNNIRHRSIQRRHIQQPRQPNRHRNIVNIGSRIESVQEPHPLLRQRQRHPLRTHPSRQRRPRTRTNLRLHPRSQQLHRRRLEQHPHRNLRIERLPQPRRHPSSNQRITTQSKEIVIQPDTLDPENVPEHRRDDLLHRRHRSPEHRNLEHRLRQQLPIQLAVRIQRHPFESDQFGRDHVAR